MVIVRVFSSWVTAINCFICSISYGVAKRWTLFSLLGIQEIRIGWSSQWILQLSGCLPSNSQELGFWKQRVKIEQWNIQGLWWCWLFGFAQLCWVMCKGDIHLKPLAIWCVFVFGLTSTSTINQHQIDDLPTNYQLMYCLDPLRITYQCLTPELEKLQPWALRWIEAETSKDH